MKSNTNSTMKKIGLVIMIISILIAFYEEQQSQKNVYIIVIAIVFFMIGMMRLSAKTPSKNSEINDEDDAKRG